MLSPLSLLRSAWALAAASKAGTNPDGKPESASEEGEYQVAAVIHAHSSSSLGQCEKRRGKRDGRGEGEEGMERKRVKERGHTNMLLLLLLLLLVLVLLLMTMLVGGAAACCGAYTCIKY